MTPQTRGIPFGSPHFDPMYEAAARNGLPVATHLMGQTPFELIPIYPVGNPAHWHDFFASWPLLYVSHLMSLVFDGAFDRHPDLRVVFVEGGFTWAMPAMWRMDRIWEQRKADLPHVRRKPSDYVREHVRFTTQPLEEVDVGEYREYLEMMDLGDNIMFSTDYPHWSYDSPDWAIRRFPADQRERIMRGNATALYGLPSTVKALPGEQHVKPIVARSRRFGGGRSASSGTTGIARIRAARDRVQPDLGQVDGRVEGVQPRHRLGDIGRPDRVHLERHVLQHLGLDGSGRDDVDVDAVAVDLLRKRPRERVHPGLRRRIGRPRAAWAHGPPTMR